MSSPRKLALVIATLLLCRSALAQLPATRLASIYPAGATAGKTVDVTITGADLDDVEQLLFSNPGITAKQKLGDAGPFDKAPPPLANQFVVTVAANVPVGMYDVRAVGKYGASNPRAFLVSDIPEFNETEPNNDREQATEFSSPGVVNGQSNQAADVDWFRFTAPAGQRIIVTAFARRIDSRLDTVVSVFDAAGRQLGGSGDDEGLDSLVDFTTPAAGQYFVKVHDSAYQGGPENVYRLAVGVLPHIDFVFPPAGVAGSNGPFTIYGRNLPGGQPAGLTIDRRPLEKLSVAIPLPAATELAFGTRLDPASAAVDAIEYRLKGPQGTSAPTLVGIATAPPVLEVEPNESPAQAQRLVAPCEVMGQFYPARDRDWFQFEAKKGEAFSLEVTSQRMGLRTSPSLLVERIVKPAADGQPEQTQQLAYVFESASLDGGSEFDVQHNDPQFRFTAAEAGTYRVMVRDTAADAPDPRRTYRLSLTTTQPDFRLAAVPVESFSSVLLRKGGQAAIRVVAFRRGGFDGEIQLTATGLPAGVTVSDAVIGPTSNLAILTLNVAPNAAPATSLIQVVGKAKLGATEVTRSARFGTALTPTPARTDVNQVFPAVDGRLTRSLPVTISATESALVTLQAGGGKTWETSRAGQLKIPIARGAGTFPGQINFVPRGLPPGVTSPAANLAANAAAGEFQVNIAATTPPGTYSFFLDGLALQTDYARNPEAAAAAAARQKEVDQIKLAVDAEAKAATDAKTAADKLAADTTAAVTAATTAKTTADQALVAAQAAATTATQAAAGAKSASTASPNDANLATAAANAQKAADEAAAKVTTATTNVAAAQKALDEATAKAKSAAEAKVVTDKKAADAAQRAQMAAQLKTQTDQFATNLANAAKPAKRNVPVVSTPITLKITPAPITLAEIKSPGPLKKGEKLEIPLAITRLYDYAGPVNFNVVLPPTAAGLTIPDAPIPAGQTQSKLTLTAAPTTAAGEHDLLVRATLNLNGQNLTLEQTVRLTVQ